MARPRTAPLTTKAGWTRPSTLASDTLRVHARPTTIAALLGVTLVAVSTWMVVLGGLDPRAMDDRGMISILPLSAYAAVALSAAAFVLTLRLQPAPTPLLAVQVLSLVFMLYGAPTFVEEMPRFVTAWLHVGFSDAIDRTAQLHPLRDARFDWPGFFVLSAFVRNIAGATASIDFLSWVPAVQMSLYVGPLYLIYRSVSSDQRLIWLAIWVFVLTNWVGQDYFSPQGFNLLLMLTIFAILLSALRSPPRGLPAWMGAVGGLIRRHLRVPLPRDVQIDPVGGGSHSAPFRTGVGLAAIVVLLFGMSVASHQLTPFAIVGGVIGLVIFGRLRMSGALPVMLVLTVSWLLFMATTFLSGHLAGLLEEVGRTEQLATAAVGDRLGGSPGHRFVVQARLGFTLVVWGLAFIGGLRRLAHGRLDLSLAILAVAPFGLLLLQSYGGEILLRVFLFSLPAMAFFMAAAILPTERPASWALSLMIAVLTVVLASGLLLTRYGNEKADMVTAAEYEALAHLAELSAPGDRIIGINHNVPSDYFEWEEHRYASVPNEFALGDAEDVIAEVAAATPPGNDAYIVLSRGQRAYAELFWNLSDEEWAERASSLEAELPVVYRNDDATILKWSGEPQ